MLHSSHRHPINSSFACSTGISYGSRREGSRPLSCNRSIRPARLAGQSLWQLQRQQQRVVHCASSASEVGAKKGKRHGKQQHDKQHEKQVDKQDRLLEPDDELDDDDVNFLVRTHYDRLERETSGRWTSKAAPHAFCWLYLLWNSPTHCSSHMAPRQHVWIQQGADDKMLADCTCIFVHVLVMDIRQGGWRQVAAVFAWE